MTVSVLERDDRVPGVVLRVVLTATAVAVLLLWWQTTPPRELHDTESVLTACGRVAGLLAAYLVLLEVLLMARLPWFERAVGQDRLAAWHRGLGTNTVLLIGLHIVLISWGYAMTDRAAPPVELWRLITTYPSMMKATIGTGLFVIVALTSGRKMRERFSYEVWYAVHLTTYLALLLVFGHQTANGAQFIGHHTLSTLWQTLYYGTFGLVVGWRLVPPLVVLWQHRVRVESVVQEAPGIVSVWLRGHHLDDLRVQPGQFMNFRFLRRGHLLAAHPYSLSAPVHNDRLRITVKALGDHSGQLAHLRPGTRAFLEGPFGRFTAERSTGRRALLVAGRSGIGPIRALAEELIGQGVRVELVYRASSRDDLALIGELKLPELSPWLRLHEVVGRRSELGHNPLGPRNILKLVPKAAECDAWICGPMEMTTSVSRALQSLGLPRHRIHTEEFALR